MSPPSEGICGVASRTRSPVDTEVVRRLTDHHEAGREHPWPVDDAPETFIHGKLKGIVGVEVSITRIEAKFKLSQNRPAADLGETRRPIPDLGTATSTVEVTACPGKVAAAAAVHVRKRGRGR